MNPDFTVVLPVRNHQKDLEWFHKIAQPSFKNIDQKIIIISNNEIGSLSDASVLTADGCTSEWKYQQTLKLAISSFIDTEFYLCCDVDCFFTGNQSYFLDNKPKVNVEQNIHKDWWVAASKFLNVERPKLQCGVTPMFLHTKTVVSMIDSFKMNGLRHAINIGATEYSLYWTYLHSLSNPREKYSFSDLSYGIYDLSEFQNIDSDLQEMKRVWDRFKKFPINLIQSTLPLNLDGLSRNLCSLL
jgi:hypothetical protein